LPQSLLLVLLVQLQFSWHDELVVFVAWLQFDLDVSVHGLLVDNLDLDIAIRVCRHVDRLLVILVRLVLDPREDLRVLWNNLLEQELFGQGKASHLFDAHVDESALAVVDDVVITDQLRAHQPLADVLLLLGDAVGHQAEADADGSLLEEVHLFNFIFFIVDEAVFFCCLKVPWEEPECNIIEKLRFNESVNIKELLKLINGEQVLEKINCQDLILKLEWQSFDIIDFIIGQTLEPVMCPEVLEVLLYLLRQGLVDTWAVGKSRQNHHPVV
jgi:hypothetical protein